LKEFLQIVSKHRRNKIDHSPEDILESFQHLLVPDNNLDAGSNENESNDDENELFYSCEGKSIIGQSQSQSDAFESLPSNLKGCCNLNLEDWSRIISGDQTEYESAYLIGNKQAEPVAWDYFPCIDDTLTIMDVAVSGTNSATTVPSITGYEDSWWVCEQLGTSVVSLVSPGVCIKDVKEESDTNEMPALVLVSDSSNCNSHREFFHLF
jgi:hypothetical protein